MPFLWDGCFETQVEILMSTACEPAQCTSPFKGVFTGCCSGSFSSTTNVIYSEHPKSMGFDSVLEKNPVVPVSHPQDFQYCQKETAQQTHPTH